MSVLPSLPGTVNSLVYVDGALTEGTVADAWRLVAASQGSGAVLKLKYVESEKGEDGHGNLFTLPPGWRSGFPGGVTSSTMVEGRTYTYAQAYALGLATANDLSANEQVSALRATIATEDGVHGKSVSVALVSPPTPLDGYNVVCHLVKSPSLSPWSGTEVTTAAFGDAMRDDVASADKMFYKVWVEIKDRK